MIERMKSASSVTAEDIAAWIQEPIEPEETLLFEDEDFLLEEGNIPYDEDVEDEEAPEAEEAPMEADVQEPSQAQHPQEEEEHPEVNEAP
ncbi:titin-like [Oryctolagus cuniculus]|uniref:titin-like n=1 Tax=Oryctolagus cuniculus TaxID=9986 RepID=UPI003879E04B